MIDFNSIKVRLNLSHILEGWGLLFNFNSIKVRLNQRMFPQCYSNFEFQFHKGTIKPLLTNFVAKDSVIFQFHKGTIKPAPFADYLDSVQLFQFHKGTIKPCL